MVEYSIIFLALMVFACASNQFRLQREINKARYIAARDDEAFGCRRYAEGVEAGFEAGFEAGLEAAFDPETMSGVLIMN